MIFTIASCCNGLTSLNISEHAISYSTAWTINEELRNAVWIQINLMRSIYRKKYFLFPFLLIRYSKFSPSTTLSKNKKSCQNDKYKSDFQVHHGASFSAAERCFSLVNCLSTHDLLYCKGHRPVKNRVFPSVREV